MGRLVRLIFFWTLGLPLFFLLGLLSILCSPRRPEEDEEELDEASAALVAGDPEDDDDDSLRRALIDLPPDERPGAILAFFNRQAMRVVPEKPLDQWAAERRLARNN